MVIDPDLHLGHYLLDQVRYRVTTRLVSQRGNVDGYQILPWRLRLFGWKQSAALGLVGASSCRPQSSNRDRMRASRRTFRLVRLRLKIVSSEITIAILEALDGRAER